MNEDNLLSQINEIWSKEFDQLLDEPVGLLRTNYRVRARKWTSKPDLVSQYRIIAAEVLVYENTKWYDPSWIGMWLAGINYKKQWLTYQNFRSDMRIVCDHKSPIQYRIQSINKLVHPRTVDLSSSWKIVFDKFIPLFEKLYITLAAGTSNMHSYFANYGFKVKLKKKPARVELLRLSKTHDVKKQEHSIPVKKIEIKDAKDQNASHLSKADMDYLVFVQCCGFLHLPINAKLDQLLSCHAKWVENHKKTSNHSDNDEVNNHLTMHNLLIEQINTLTERPYPSLQVMPEFINSAYSRGKRLHNEVVKNFDKKDKTKDLIKYEASYSSTHHSGAKLLTAEQYYFYITLITIFNLKNSQSLTMLEVQNRKRKLLATLHPDRILSEKDLPQSLQKKFYKIRENLFIIVRDVADGLIKHFSSTGVPPRPLIALDQLEKVKIDEAIQVGQQCANNITMPQVNYCLITLLDEHLNSIINPLNDLATKPELMNSIPFATRESIKSMLSGEFGVSLAKSFELIKNGKKEELLAYLLELESLMEKYKHVLSVLAVNASPANPTINTIGFFKNALSDQATIPTTLYADEKGELNIAPVIK